MHLWALQALFEYYCNITNYLTMQRQARVETKTTMAHNLSDGVTRFYAIIETFHIYLRYLLAVTRGSARLNNIK